MSTKQDLTSKLPLNTTTTEFDIGNAYSLAQVSSLAYKKFERGQSPSDTTATANDPISDYAFFIEQVKQWEFSTYYFFDCKNIDQDAQGLVLANDDQIIIAFRGTETSKIQDVFADLRLAQVERLGGKVHRGFFAAFSSLWNSELRIWQGETEIVQKPGIKSIVQDLLQTKKRPIAVTGHSLGGAMAVLGAAACGFELKNLQPEISLYTYGQPRVGNTEFNQTLMQNIRAFYRIVNNNDVVPRVPADVLKKVSLLDYKHTGDLVYLDTQQKVHRQDLGWWQQTKDEMWGRLADLGKLGTDGIKDHDLGSYNKILHNAWQNPQNIV